jgi:hypothetical protein
MPEREQIAARIQRLRRRRRGQLVLEGAVRGLFFGACAAALLLLLSKLWILPIGGFGMGPLPGELVMAISFVLAGAMAGAVLGWLRKLSLLAVANDVDLRLGLRERISSALAMDAPTPASRPFVDALVKDAAEAVRDVPARSVYPWGLPRLWQRAAVSSTGSPIVRNELRPSWCRRAAKPYWSWQSGWSSRRKSKKTPN